MKFKQSKNRKNKLHVKFDAEDRKDYLLGFHKRKLERKEKAKEQIKELLRKEKIEVKKKRTEFLKKLIDETSIKFDGEDNDSSSDEAEKEEPVVTEYGDCTVEVSELDLKHNMFLGQNQETLKFNPGASTSKPESTETSKSSGKFSLINKISNKVLKTSIWKSANKSARRSVNSEKRKKKKKKKKTLVTQL